jgi:undecaprenyl-diphosphatase
VAEHRVAPLDWLFLALTVAGYAGLLWVALAAVLALRAGRPALVVTALTAATVWAADLITLVLKTTIDRQRPYETVTEIDTLLRAAVGNSFPSGHAATSFAGAVILGHFFPRALPALLVLAALVAASRVYVGVHYPLDVVGGAALGALVGLAVLGALRVRRRTSGGRRRSGATQRAR